MTELKPNIVVLKDDGTNCDEETKHALELAGANSRVILLGDVITGRDNLKGVQGLVLPGGFSNGDVPRAGVIHALKLRVIGDIVTDLIARGGITLGVCNGFQGLTESCLLPGGRLDAPKTAVLTTNNVGHFVCKPTHLRVEKDCICPFLKEMDDVVTFQMAHGEGRFIVDSLETLDELQNNRQIAFRYSDENGVFSLLSNDFYNPNGSIRAIAGICDPTGRILGLMPHPERSVTRFQDPNWRRKPTSFIPQGLPLFQGMVRYAKES